MDTTSTRTRPEGADRRVASSIGHVALACVALLLCAAISMAPTPATTDGFRDSLEIAGGYHRALANLPAKYADQPETAWYEFQRLTAETLDAQFAVEVRPCFARWWAYEYMGLELTAMSHELRRTHDDYEDTADMLERLGTRMWANAKSLLPSAASACGWRVRRRAPNSVCLTRLDRLPRR